MSGSRYLALIARDGAARSAWERASAAAFAAHHGFEKHLLGERLAVVAESRSALPITSEGFVIGSLFERGRAHALTSIDKATARSIIASRGDLLLRAYWGAYIALLVAPDGSSIDMIRSPFGDLGAYLLQSEHGLLVASDVELLARFSGYRAQIDWPAVAQHLVAADLRRRQTCLEGVEELSGGERVTDAAGRWAIDAPWRIWDLVAPESRLDDPLEAARRVRDAVALAVAARANAHDKVLLRLSGGLDSSIVAACLARAGRPFVALTLATRDRAGDERGHARAVANQLGVPLVEAMRDVGFVDLRCSEARNLPRPSVRGFAQATTRIATSVALEHGASAILDGGGGDNMFASLQSPAPAADCLLHDGGIGHFWRTARSIGIAAQTSTFTVARRAFERVWTRGPAFRWPVDLSLLSAEAKDMALHAADHPWLVPPERALPGSAAHVALLAAAQSLVQGRGGTAPLPEISPLVAQPVAEACLRVPSWLWTRDGHDRVVARDAFRGALPAAIIDRRDKGAPDSFVVELIEANRSLIRTMLLDGLLARHGILDRAALEGALAPAAVAKGYGYVRLMQLVDAEAWARSWHDGAAGAG